MAVTHNHENPRRDPTLARGPGLDRVPRESVGETLRRAREAHGEDLRSVSQVLRIRHAYLDAIESGHYDVLPGTTYAIGFLRTYAEYLGLGGNAIVDRFKEEVEGVDERTELVFPEPVAEGRIPGAAIIMISVLLLGVVYGGWLYLSNGGTTISQVLPEMPDRLQTMLEAERNAPADRPASQGAAGPVPGETKATGSADEATADVPAAPVVAAPAGPGPSAPSAGEAPAPAAPQVATRPAPGVETQPAARRPIVAAQQAEASQAAAATAPAVDQGVAPAPNRGGDTVADQDRPAPPPVPEPPAATAPEAPAPTAQAASDLGRPIPSAPQESPPPLVEQTAVIPAPPSAPALVIPTERTPRIYGERGGGSRIVLRALQDSWVQVRDRQDSLLLTRVLRAGDTYYVPNQAGLTLLTGNAGGIEIEVDGVKAPPLGPIGSVRRQIALDPDRLLGGASAGQ